MIGSSSKEIWLACLVMTLAIGCGKAKTPPVVSAVASDTQSESAHPESAQTEPDSSIPTEPTISTMPEATETDDTVAIPDPNAEPIVVAETHPTESVAEPTDEPATVEIDANPRPILDATPFRVLLPTAEGPLIVDLDIRIDDVALETAFNQRIQKVIADSDTDKNSTATWDELLDHLASDAQAFGRGAATNMGQRRNIVQLHDRNRNALADPEEVAQYLFRSSNFTKSFRLQGTNYYRRRQSKSRLFAALDRDDSKTLESGEIDMAAESLLRVDRNTDQRLDVSEILPPTVPNVNDPAWNNRRISRDGSVPTDLHGYVDWSMATYSLGGMSKKRPFALSTNPILGLDEDADGSISTKEAKKLRDADSDLIIRVDLLSTHADPKLTVAWANVKLQEVVQICKSNAAVAFADTKTRLCVQLSDRQIGNNQLPPEAFAMLDGDSNGFLEESEIPAQFLQQYSFDDLDSDNDDKLTIDEIRDGMRPKSPIWSVQVRGRAAEFPDAFFAYFDQDNDLALCTREILGASQKLRDLAGEKTLDAETIPDTMLIQLVRGDPMQRDTLFAFKARKSTNHHFINAPRWARSMDANSDGDISGIEFPGTQKAFAKLDINGDGLIALDELTSNVASNPDVTPASTKSE